MVHAVRKANYRGECNVRIYMLNTRKLKEVAIYPAVKLLQAYHIRSEGKLCHDYYSAEYLAHGGIEGGVRSFETVLLQDLIEQHGLYDIFPEFNDPHEKHKLYLRFMELRHLFFAEPSPLTRFEIASLKGIGMCFGGELALPATMAFTSLRLRNESDVNTLKSLLEELHDLCIPPDYLDECIFGDASSVTIGCLEEVSQFRHLMRKLCYVKSRDHAERSNDRVGEEVLVEGLSNLACTWYLTPFNCGNLTD